MAGRFLVFLANLALLDLVLFTALAAGLLLGRARVDLAALGAIHLNLFALSACLGGLSFLASLAFSDYTRGMLAILPLQLGLFLLNSLLDEGRGILRVVNPYSYYVGASILGGAQPWGGILVLSLGAAVFWLGGIWLFARKQVS